MQRFTVKVKLFALDERHAGKTWKQVQQNVKQKFNIDPPSIRMMEKWHKELDRDKLTRQLIDEASRNVPGMQTISLQEMAKGLIPVLWQARDAGEDMEKGAWLWFFSIIERQLGEERLKQYFEDYQDSKQNQRGPQ